MNRYRCGFDNAARGTQLPDNTYPCDKPAFTFLNSRGIFDTDAEQRFDELVELAAIICGTSVAMVSSGDNDCQWLQFRKGFESDHRSRADTGSTYSSQQDEAFVILDTTQVARTADSLTGDGRAGIRFYAEVPIEIEEGPPVGYLYVCDTRARTLDKVQLESLAMLSRQIAALVKMHQANARTEKLRSIVADQLRKLRQANVRLRDVDTNRVRFLAVLAHELRNPLSALQYGLATIPGLASSADKQQPGFLDSISMMSTQCHQLTCLLNDLMDLSRVERGQLVLNRSTTDLSSVLRSSLGSVEAMAEQKGHRITVIYPDESVFLMADATRLVQIVVNLLVNAIKYTPVDGQIQLGVTVTDTSVCIYVQDNGFGIAVENQPNVFSIFSQIESGDGHRGEGLGLGLALVKELVRLHMGKVEVSSEGEGQGSRFSVHLPRTEPPETEITEQNCHPDDESESVNAKDILIVDDNYPSIRPLGMLLERGGHRVRLCVSGQEALDACKERQPDIALVDISMPAMTGHEFAGCLRTIYPDNDIQLIAMSGHSQPEDRIESVEAGFARHLVKPLDVKYVLSLISELE